ASLPTEVTMPTPVITGALPAVACNWVRDLLAKLRRELQRGLELDRERRHALDIEDFPGTTDRHSPYQSQLSLVRTDDHRVENSHTGLGVPHQIFHGGSDGE